MTSSKLAKTLFAARPAGSLCRRLLTTMPPTGNKWCQRFDRYHVASGLAHKSEKEQVSIFLYAMGDCADDILATLSVDEETISFADIKTELNNYFGAARQNVVVERARFNKRAQRQSEAIDSFIQDLYKISCRNGLQLRDPDRGVGSETGLLLVWQTTTYQNSFRAKQTSRCKRPCS